MDFKPLPKGIEALRGRFADNFIFGHTFAKYQVDEQGLDIFPLNGDYVEDLVEQKKIRLKHERLKENFVLTASTNELRSFIEKYETDEKLFEQAENLISL